MNWCFSGTDGRLERDVGHPLFHRATSAHPQSPTTRGEALLRDLHTEHVKALMSAGLPPRHAIPEPDAATIAATVEELRNRRRARPRPPERTAGPRLRIRPETRTILRDLLDHQGEEDYGPQLSARTNLRQSSLSTRLRQFEQVGWVSSRVEDDESWQRRATPGRGPGRRRTFYTLTPQGVQAAHNALRKHEAPTATSRDSATTG